MKGRETGVVERPTTVPLLQSLSLVLPEFWLRVPGRGRPIRNDGERGGICRCGKAFYPLTRWGNLFAVRGPPTTTPRSIAPPFTFQLYVVELI